MTRHQPVGLHAAVEAKMTQKLSLIDWQVRVSEAVIQLAPKNFGAAFAHEPESDRIKRRHTNPFVQVALVYFFVDCVDQWPGVVSEILIFDFNINLDLFAVRFQNFAQGGDGLAPKLS